MGAAGREHARRDYDWTVISRRYQTLWEELAERRRSDPDLHTRLTVTTRPDRPDPFAAFASYPTTQLTSQHLIAWRKEAEMLDVRRKLNLDSFAQPLQLTAEECSTIIALLKANGPLTVGRLLEQFPNIPNRHIMRGLGWLAKMEAVRITLP